MTSLSYVYRNYAEGGVRSSVLEIQSRGGTNPLPPLVYAPDEKHVSNKNKFYNNEELIMWFIHFTLFSQMNKTDSHKLYKLWSDTAGYLHKIYYSNRHKYTDYKNAITIITKKVVSTFREISIVPRIVEVLRSRGSNTGINNRLVYLTNLIRPVYLYMHLINLKYYDRYGMTKSYLFTGYYLSSVIFSLVPEIKIELDHMTEDIFPSYLIGNNPNDQGKKYHAKLRVMLFGVYYPNLDIDEDKDVILKDIYEYIDFIPSWLGQIDN